MSKNFKWCHGLIFIASLLTYSPIIFNNNPIDIDNKIVITPIENIQAGKSYQKIKLDIFDVQPIRDIALLFQAWIKSKINYQVYTFTNWLLTAVMALLLIRTFLFLKVNQLQILVGTSIFLFHPLLSWVIYWPSAQKHLLACTFISFAAYFCIKKYLESAHKYNFKIWLFYFLSVFSQPITIFAIVPYVFFFKNWLRKKQEIILAAMLLLTFFLVGILNYFYYSELYPIQANVNKVTNLEFNLNLANAILSFSRSFSQIFIPINFSINYVKLSPLSFIGLPIFVLAGYSLFASKGLKILLSFISLSLFPLLSVYSRKTNVFISDTYLIWTLYITITFFTYYFLKVNKKSAYIYMPLIFVLGAKANYEAKITGNKNLYFKASYTREPTCKTAAQYLAFLRSTDPIDKRIFMQVSEDFLKNKCLIIGGGSSLSITDSLSIYFFLTDKITTKEKIRNVERFSSRTIVNDAILLHLYRKNGNSRKEKGLTNRLKKYKSDVKAEAFLNQLKKRASSSRF